MSVQRTSHAVYDTNYHLVWAPKYRKWIVREDIRRWIEQLFRQIAEDFGFELDELEVVKDHVHIFRLDKNYPVGHVRAFGVNKAKGEYIASIDADCIPTPNWLTMIKYLDDETAVVGFPVFPPPEYDYLDQKFEYQE